MENDKKFTSEMFGYSKKEVEEYIKDMKADYEGRRRRNERDARNGISGLGDDLIDLETRQLATLARLV